MLSERTYEFMQKNYSFPYIKTNNRGHLNGENGDRGAFLKKEKNIISIEENFIDSIHLSTTGMHISAQHVAMEIKKIIKQNKQKDQNYEL